MASLASTSSFEERYKLTVNGQSIPPALSNDLELRNENTVVLRPAGLETLSADLYIDGRLIAEKSRPYDAPEAVAWRWILGEASNRHALRLQIEGDAEYWFEISAKKEWPGEGNLRLMADEMRNFSLNLTHFRYGDEIERRQNAWLNHISEHWEALGPILEMIARSPHRRLAKRRVEKPIHELDRIDAETLNSIISNLEDRVTSKGSGASMVKMLLEGVPLRVMTEEKYLEYDVAENRLLRHHLNTLLSQLKNLLETSVQRDTFLRRDLKLTEGEETVEAARVFLSNYDVMKSIKMLRGRIEARHRDPRLSFLEQVAPLEPPPSATTFLESHPQYRRFHQIYLFYSESAPQPLLQTTFPLLETAQDLSELYSPWCMVKILEAAMRLDYELQEERVTSLEDQRIAAAMPQGLLSILTKGGSRLEIFYGKRYSNEAPYGSYSAPKMVSIALEEFGEDEVPCIVVFEPRYDLDYTEEKFESVDIDRLHALRDAIVDLRTDSRRRLVVGGCILHPSNMGRLQHDGLSAVSLRPGMRDGGLDEILGELLE